MSLLLVLAIFAYVRAACPAVAGVDLSTIDGQTVTGYVSGTNTLDYAICTTISSGGGCGAAGGAPAHCAGQPTGCTGICERWVDQDGNPQGAALGSISSATASNGVVSLFYSGGDAVTDPSPGPRVAYINISCDPNAGALKTLGFIQPDPNNHQPNAPWVYTIQASSAGICGGGGPTGGGGIAGGGVFLILFFVFPAIYLIGGVLFNRFHLQKEGAEMIPNYEFWVESPSLFLAGCSFTWAKITGLCSKDNYTTIS